MGSLLSSRGHLTLGHSDLFDHLLLPPIGNKSEINETTLDEIEKCSLK